jgi:hypothetical protein
MSKRGHRAKAVLNRTAQEETEMRIVKLAALVALSLPAGCSSTGSSASNSWQRVENYFMNPARSCASGYYDCSLRTSNRARDESRRH